MGTVMCSGDIGYFSHPHIAPAVCNGYAGYKEESEKAISHWVGSLDQEIDCPNPL